MEDNFDSCIVSLATARGQGAISIVRLSGNGSLNIALKIVKKTYLTPRVATLATLYDSHNEPFDQSLVIYFNAPKSYTGEEVIEFQTHGGDMIASMLIDLIISLGAKPAMPGEFTKRAFLNGKIDITKAEAISALITSKSQNSAKLLTRVLKGELSNYIEDIRKELIEAMAYVEVTIDYAEEDLPVDILNSINLKLTNIQNTLNKSYEASIKRDGLLSGYKIAIIGKPNVGKSSFLNAILNYERAIVSDIEGTTRDLIDGELKIGTHIVKIVDTAGIRETQNQIEKIGIEYSKKSVSEADIVISLFDNSREFDENDQEILKIINQHKDKKYLAIINKSDLESKFDKNKIDNLNPIVISCKKSVENITKEIENILATFDYAEEQILISKRQIKAVKDAIYDIKSSLNDLNCGSLELFSYHIQNAINSITSITKPFEYDEMLDVMFGEFCLGK